MKHILKIFTLLVIVCTVLLSFQLSAPTAAASDNIPLCSSSEPWKPLNSKYEITSKTVTNYTDKSWAEIKATPGLCKKISYTIRTDNDRSSYDTKTVKYKLNSEVLYKVKTHAKIKSSDKNPISRSWGGW